MTGGNDKPFRNWGEQEFRKFICSYGGFFIAFARRYTTDDASAADIVQDCLYRLWLEKSKKRNKHISNPSAYLLIMIRNAAVSAHRKNRLTILHLWFNPENHIDDGFLESMYAKENMCMIEEGLSTLPHNWKKVMQMALRGLSNDEIAVSLGRSSDSVKAIKRRASKRLREYVSHYEPSNR